MGTVGKGESGHKLKMENVIRHPARNSETLRSIRQFSTQNNRNSNGPFRSCAIAMFMFVDMIQMRLASHMMIAGLPKVTQC